MSYGEFIRAARDEKDYSIRYLAEQLGISGAYWSTVELGQVGPPSDKLIELAAQILEIPVDTAYIEAGRLPPDMRGDLEWLVAAYRATEGKLREA